MKADKKKSKKKGKQDRPLSFSEIAAATLVKNKLDDRNEQAVEAMKEGIQRIEKVKEQYKNAIRDEQIVGRVAEEFHAASLNASARTKGDLKLNVKTSSASGKSTSSGDIYKDGKAIAEIKYEKSAVRNAAATSKDKYAGQQRVVPKEHADDARKILKAQAKKNSIRNPPKAKLRAETAEKVTDRVSVKSKGKTIESVPLSLKEAKEIKDNPSRALQKTPKTKLANEIAHGAMGGAAMGAAFSAATNAKDVFQGKKQIGDAAKDVAIDSFKSGAKTAANIVLAQGVKKGLAGAGAKTLAKGNLPIMVASAVIDTAGDAVDFFKGNIDGGELAKRSAKNVGSTAAGWAGAKAGAVAGSFIGGPGIGTAVGGVVGGLLGVLGFGKLIG